MSNKQFYGLVVAMGAIAAALVVLAASAIAGGKTKVVTKVVTKKAPVRFAGTWPSLVALTKPKAAGRIVCPKGVENANCYQLAGAKFYIFAAFPKSPKPPVG